MKYYKFIADTPFSGTENTHYVSFNRQPTEKELEEYAESYRDANADDFEYLVYGWDADPVGDGEMTQEEYDESMENYYADCSCEWEEISREEFEENS